MKRILNGIRKLFFPPAGSSRWLKIVPFVIMSFVFLALLVSGAYAWEYTNSPEFCGMQCHSMPPEYTSYQQSPHARIKCVECHIGREFVGNQFTRKAGDLRHVIAQISNNYEYPLEAHTMRPASETCEKCHSAEKVADDSQRVIYHFDTDEANTLSRTYLTLKTGGGIIEEGLGHGIHWHIANKVTYYATDDSEQDIPYVKITDVEGLSTEYLDVNANFDPYTLDESEMKEMDCITCHNRITHAIPQPEDAVDELLFRRLISPDVPEIRLKAVEVLRGSYTTIDQAMTGIGTLTGYYQNTHPDYYDLHGDAVFQAVNALKDFYKQSVFPDQKVDWDSHPDNLGHQKDPGCFRCHDGQHMNIAGFAIPLECNLCHAIPVVSGADDPITHLDIYQEQQPDTHGNPNWIALHTIVFDEDDVDDPCSGCHDVSNYDQADNTSFCANSACHGGAVEHIDFEFLNDPTLNRRLMAQLPHYPADLELIADWVTPSLDTIHRVQEELVCEDCHDVMPPVGPAANEMCIACHGETEQGIFELTAYLEPNPHDQHEGSTSCALCHPNFGPERSPCALCHEDIAMVPVEGTGE